MIHNNFREVYFKIYEERLFTEINRGLQTCGRRLAEESRWALQPRVAKEVEAPKCIYDLAAIKPGTIQPCVVIIGAGMAGLSAAHRLIQCGISNFKIVEALDRPGGRMKSCWFGDTNVEMGVPYIDGASLANPVFTLGAQERLFKSPLERLEPEADIILTSDGRAIDSRLTTKAKKIFRKIENEATQNTNADSSSSLSAQLDAMIGKYLEKASKIERWDLTRALFGLKTALRDKLGESLSNVSANTLSSMASLPGGTVKVPLGLNGLLAPLIRNLPQGALVHNKPVYCIRWGTVSTNSPRAVVMCCDGQEYPADYVIVTVSLGVLKNMYESMFCPGLPAAKVQAIKNLGFGNVEKIYLKYKKPFWSASDGSLLLAWTPEELTFSGPWSKGISSIETVSSSVLCATVSGAGARDVNFEDDLAIVTEIQRVLRRFTGDSFLPPPTEVMRSGWHKSKYCFGSFSFIGMGAGVGMIKDLARPLPCICDEVPPIILFAGEHTHPCYFSTLHGARLSGIREADRITELTKAFGGPPRKIPDCKPCETPL